MHWSHSVSMMICELHFLYGVKHHSDYKHSHSFANTPVCQTLYEWTGFSYAFLCFVLQRKKIVNGFASEHLKSVSFVGQHSHTHNGEYFVVVFLIFLILCDPTELFPFWHNIVFFSNKSKVCWSDCISTRRDLEMSWDRQQCVYHCCIPH